MSTGYVRVGTDLASDDEAVQWWYYWEYDDGWGFARGGRCRTLRDARRLLRSCHGLRERERRAFLDRQEYELMGDGSLREINRGPYDIAKWTWKR